MHRLKVTQTLPNRGQLQGAVHKIRYRYDNRPVAVKLLPGLLRAWDNINHCLEIGIHQLKSIIVCNWEVLANYVFRVPVGLPAWPLF